MTRGEAAALLSRRRRPLRRGRRRTGAADRGLAGRARTSPRCPCASSPTRTGGRRPLRRRRSDRRGLPARRAAVRLPPEQSRSSAHVACSTALRPAVRRAARGRGSATLLRDLARSDLLSSRSTARTSGTATTRCWREMLRAELRRARARSARPSCTGARAPGTPTHDDATARSATRSRRATRGARASCCGATPPGMPHGRNARRPPLARRLHRRARSPADAGAGARRGHRAPRRRRPGPAPSTGPPRPARALDACRPRRRRAAGGHRGHACGSRATGVARCATTPRAPTSSSRRTARGGRSAACSRARHAPAAASGIARAPCSRRARAAGVRRPRRASRRSASPSSRCSRSTTTTGHAAELADPRARAGRALPAGAAIRRMASCSPSSALVRRAQRGRVEDAPRDCAAGRAPARAIDRLRAVVRGRGPRRARPRRAAAQRRGRARALLGEAAGLRPRRPTAPVLQAWLEVSRAGRAHSRRRGRRAGVADHRRAARPALPARPTSRSARWRRACTCRRTRSRRTRRRSTASSTRRRAPRPWPARARWACSSLVDPARPTATCRRAHA